MERVKTIEIIVGALIIVLAVAFVLQNAFSDTPSEPVDSQTVSDQDDVADEKATRDKPHVPIVNPEFASGETKLVGASFFNQGFDSCDQQGAYLDLTCPEEIDVTVDSKPTSIPIDTEGLVLGNVTVSGSQGTYRCSFDVVCEGEVLASSRTSVRILAE